MRGQSEGRSQLDAIAPREIVTETIELSSGSSVTVRGLSSRDFLMLRRRYPPLKDAAFLASLGTDQLSDEQAEVLLDAMPAVIACGLGEAGSAKTERLAVDVLSEADQLALFNAIIGLTGSGASQTARPLPNGREPGLVEPLATQTTI